MLILHGDNSVKSRNELQIKLDEASGQSIEIVRFDAKKINPRDLEEALGSSSLFGGDRLIVIEELHSLPPSERKKELINFISASNSETEIVLWEKRALTATMLKPFKSATVKEFKTSNYLFNWLDTLGNNDPTKSVKAFHEALKHEDEMYCYIMFCRQIRLLIQAKDNVKMTGAPFMISKLTKQAQSFKLEQLLKIHSKLLAIDLAIKTSKLRNSVAAEIDLIQLTM